MTILIQNKLKSRLLSLFWIKIVICGKILTFEPWKVNCSHFMSFGAIFMVDSSFYQACSKLFIYIKIICIICLFTTEYGPNPQTAFLTSKIFQIYHLLFSKNNFFEVSNFFEIFLRNNWDVYVPGPKNWNTLLNGITLKNANLVTWGLILAYFWPSRAKKGQKKGKQINYFWTKIAPKKIYVFWLFLKKKIRAVR